MRISVANGEVDLRTGELHPHCRESYCMKSIAYEYKPEAGGSDESAMSGGLGPGNSLRRPAMLWRKFLETVFNNDAELMDYVQRVVGYCLTADTTEQCFFIAHGEGQNGKSTFIEVILRLMGSYAVKASAETFLAGKHSTIRNDLARLAGARFAAGMETGADRKMALEVMKELTGTDSITARFLHREFFTFKPTFKIFIATNHKPVIDDTGPAIWRRIRLIPFAVRIPDDQRDNTLSVRLQSREVMESVLAWAVEGAVRWYGEGLRIPASVAQATEQYRQEQDAVERFLAERCVRLSFAKIQAAKLYAAFRAWAEENGEGEMTQKGFFLGLQIKGYRRVVGGKGYKFYEGLDVMSDREDEE